MVLKIIFIKMPIIVLKIIFIKIPIIALKESLASMLSIPYNFCIFLLRSNN